MPLIIVSKGVPVEIPRVVRNAGERAIQAYLKEWKPGTPCLAGVPFISPVAGKLAKEHGADAFDFKSHMPESEKGFSADEVKAILGIVEKEPEKAPEGGE